MEAVAAVVLALLSVGLLWYAWREISALPEEAERSSGLQHRMRPPEEPPERPDDGPREPSEEDLVDGMPPGPEPAGSPPAGRGEPGPGAESAPGPGTAEELARGLFGDEPGGGAEAPEEEREKQEGQDRTAPGPDVGPLGSEAAEPPEERDVGMGLPEYVPPEGRGESADGEAPAEDETAPGDENEAAGAEEAAAEETAPAEPEPLAPEDADEAAEVTEEAVETPEEAAGTQPGESGPPESAREETEGALEEEPTEPETPETMGSGAGDAAPEEGPEERDDEGTAAGQEPVAGPADTVEPLPDRPDEEARDTAGPAADQERDQERAERAEPGEPAPGDEVEAPGAAAAGAAAAGEAAGAEQPGPAEVDYELFADESHAGRGFRVRRAPGGDPIPWRSLPLEEGLLALDVAGVRNHVDVAQLAEFAPGEPVRLVPEDAAGEDGPGAARTRVVVYDASREYRVGHVPEDRSELVAELIRADPGYRGVALWETTEDGQVVGLRILITASDASIRLPGDPPD